MDYKEKYEKALAKAKEQYNYPTMASSMGILEEIFPELKESEDKRIAKELLTFFRESMHGGHILTNKEYDSWIAWLEKQGEQPQGKSALEAAQEEKVDNANKVEPRQEEFTEFEKAVKQVMEEVIECGDTHNLKADADMLLRLAQKPAWSEEDELIINKILCICNDFEKSFEISPASTKVIKEDVNKIDNWLKSLRPKLWWKPSEENIKDLEWCAELVKDELGTPFHRIMVFIDELKKLKER